MASVWKDILYPGRWHLPDGRTFDCSASDLTHFTGRMRDMMQAGLSIPLSWEHQASVKPGNADEARAERTKLTLGHTKQARSDAGFLETELEVPDAADAKKLPAVRFVSPYIEWDFVDGTGKKWEGPSITHIAVTPRPIQHTQRPFAMSHTGAGSRNLTQPICMVDHAGARNSYPIALSLSDYKGPSMPDDVMDDDETPNPKATKTGDDDTEGEGGTPPPADDQAGDVAEVVDLLAQHKIILGDGVTMENFFDRLKAALHTKAAHDGTGEGGPNNPETQAQATEVAMSHGTPDFNAMKARAERAEAKLIKAEHASLLSRIKNLSQTGRIAKTLHDSLLKQANAVSLSLDSDGAVAGSPIIYKVEAYEALPANSAFPVDTKNAQEVAPPTELTTPAVGLSAEQEKAQQDAGDDIARMAGAPVKEPERQAA